MRNIFDYSKMLFNKKYGDFGLFQLPMIPMAGILSVGLLGLLIFNSREQIKRYFLVLKTYQFNIFEYISDSWANFTTQFWFLNLNLKSIVMIGVFFSVSIFILYKGLKLFNEKIQKSKPALVTYVFLYYFFLAGVWLLVFKDLILKRDVKWK
jgi:hypothetical protein